MHLPRALHPDTRTHVAERKQGAPVVQQAERTVAGAAWYSRDLSREEELQGASITIAQAIVIATALGLEVRGE